jgi:hypothetical protein
LKGRRGAVRALPTLEERWDAQLNLCCGGSITVLAEGCHQHTGQANPQFVRHYGKRAFAGGALFLRWNSGRPALGEVANPVIQLELFFELRVGDFDLDAAVGAVLALV